MVQFMICVEDQRRQSAVLPAANRASLRQHQQKDCVLWDGSPRLGIQIADPYPLLSGAFPISAFLVFSDFPAVLRSFFLLCSFVDSPVFEKWGRNRMASIQCETVCLISLRLLHSVPITAFGIVEMSPKYTPSVADGGNKTPIVVLCVLFNATPSNLVFLTASLL